MKKIVKIIIAVVLVAAVLFGLTMLVKKVKDNTALATADKVYELSNAQGTITISEDVAIEMLSKYSNKSLGITKPIKEYVVRLSEAEFNGNAACQVELHLTDEKDSVAEARYIIAGYDCYVYDMVKSEYLLLTLEGAFQVQLTTEKTTEDETTLFYDEQNNKVLHKMIDKYSKVDLGFQKEPGEYIMVVTGGVIKAKDGKDVYIVRMYEEDGKMTNYTCAFADESVYKYDTELKMYVKI